MPVEELRQEPMMAHLLDSLEQGQGHRALRQARVRHGGAALHE
jgi:hypothetical protein